jgi:hypothetical protein
MNNEDNEDDTTKRMSLTSETKRTLGEVTRHSHGLTGKVARAIEAGLITLRDDTVLAPDHREALEEFAWRVSESTPSPDGPAIGMLCVIWRDAVLALLGALRSAPLDPIQGLCANLATSLTPQQAEQLERPLSERQRGLFQQIIDLTRGDKAGLPPSQLDARDLKIIDEALDATIDEGTYGWYASYDEIDAARAKVRDLRTRTRVDVVIDVSHGPGRRTMTDHKTAPPSPSPSQLNARALEIIDDALGVLIGDYEHSVEFNNELDALRVNVRALRAQLQGDDGAPQDPGRLPSQLDARALEIIDDALSALIGDYSHSVEFHDELDALRVNVSALLTQLQGDAGTPQDPGR